MRKRIIYTLAPAIALMLGLIGVYLVGLALGIETVSFTFLLGFPAIATCVILYFRPKAAFQGLFRSLLWLVGVMFGAVILAFVAKLEGLICIAMMILPFLGVILAIGILYLMIERWRGGLMVLTLPLGALMLLAGVQGPAQVHEISNSVVIAAPPALVFGMLKTIPDISPDEVPSRLSHYLGIPKPTAALWEETATGAVRHSFWGGDVRFDERITKIVENREIAWDFVFPEGWAAEGIEDPHVKVGGAYFDILSGGYRLDPVAGGTRLTLVTRTYDSSGLGAYAKFWHFFFFEDFHMAILDLVKARVEAL